MSNFTRSQTSRTSISTMAKVAALIAALGFVTLMLERPQLTASPRRASATMEQSIQMQRCRRSAGRFTSDESQSSTTAQQPLPAYFPGQFSLPDGTIEQQPTGF